MIYDTASIQMGHSGLQPKIIRLYRNTRPDELCSDWPELNHADYNPPKGGPY